MMTRNAAPLSAARNARSLVAGLLGAGILLRPSLASAATSTANMGVSATVQATCLVSTTPLAFGTYTGVAAVATASLNVTCTNTTPYNVGLDPGQTTGATVTTRRMLNGSVALSYGLFSDSARSVNWGNTSGSWVGGTGNGGQQTLTVYGAVPAAQYIAPNTYNDTILATVNY